MNSSINENFEQMEILWEEFRENHNKFITKGNKSAGARARKTLGQIKKLITPYRKSSVEVTK